MQLGGVLVRVRVGVRIGVRVEFGIGLRLGLGYRVRVQVAADEPNVGAALATVAQPFVQRHHRGLSRLVREWVFKKVSE